MAPTNNSGTGRKNTSNARNRRAKATNPGSGNPAQSQEDQSSMASIASQRAEIEQLQILVQELRATADAAREQAAQAQAAQAQATQAQTTPVQTGGSATVAPIPRPHGDAGKHFNLRDAMGLGEDPSLYRSIQRTVKHATIQSGIDLHSRFKALPVDKLANIYKKVRDTHEYIDRRRFPADWPVVELLKQFLKNHRKYDRKMGRLEPYRTAQEVRSQSHARSGNLPNIDDDDSSN
ncbi:hypothetical protein H1R20_g15488, partial [Candolleomyces eurysporus]